MKPERKKGALSWVLILSSIFCSLIFVVSPKSVTAFPQDSNFYYYSSGYKNTLPLSKAMLAVRFKQEVSLQQRKAIVQAEENLALFSQRKELSVFKLALFPRPFVSL